ncbi:uncharacterized protein SPAPADRAFT_52957 [Spathaspora passalidarum NRRL Y-27907]|uniref:Mitochondrial distribution and morphology protein 12 n=1 Tax=Spathaspora passalidarum (strain NRRL Y-27907 / 11-Y1) TaxID=619300 RepID=G3AV55_SPAPN|nr:uncharacterized protein SPAPADRAFT_52957 [Spathaspora passalidarum NRRL Y-27907]EGW30129.1 hypothetical protein SPAPADRAFT_52957 [Spathaspora passalidarum NRRL Y-27907]
MSFDINWDKLTEDNSLNEVIQEFLDEQFQKIQLPSFISDLKVAEFNLGTIPPEITIRHICDPFEEFYEEECPEVKAEKLETHPEEEEEDQTASKQDEDEEDYDEENDEEDDDALFQSITEDVSLLNINRPLDVSPSTPLRATPFNPSPSPPSRPLPPLRTHDAYHSYNNIIGLGTQPATGSDTPTTILNPNLRAPRIYHRRKSPNKGNNDLQLIVEINYKGDVHINLLVNLLVNYPAPNFITLPIKLHVTDLVIHSICALAYLKKSVFWTFLCDITDINPMDYFTNNLGNLQRTESNRSNSGANFVDYYNESTPNSNKERIDIIKKVKIESEIGEVEQNVLRNVGKVEKFLVEKLRNILREEMAWPSWICFDLNDQEDSDEEGSDN